MDSGSETPRKSKRRFQPRPPTPSPRPIAPISNTEAEEEENLKAAKQIAQRIGIRQTKPKTVTKASAEVAYQANAFSAGIKSFGVPKEDDKRGSDVKPSSSTDILPEEDDKRGSDVKPSPSTDIIANVSSAATPSKDEVEAHTLVTVTKEEEYIPPWDYKNSYYPTVLPLRNPNSGDPELCDQEEFGELAKHPEYDERTINSAKELGLTSQQHCKDQMYLFKIPDCLPVMNQLRGKNTQRSISDHSSNRNSPFEGLSEGFMGKMLVYKSGAVKLKLGDVLFDVSPGPKTKFYTDVAAIETKGCTCTRIGSSTKFATITPDVESLMNSASDMETHK